MPTNYEIANDYGLWGEYVDPQATMSEEQFYALSVSERLAMITECFGAEEDEDQS